MRRVLPIVTIVGALLCGGCTSGRDTGATSSGVPSGAAMPTPTSTSASTATHSPSAVTSSSAPRPSTSKASLSPLSSAARAAGLVDIRTIVPDAIVDLRYATTNNFTHVRLYPRDARCLVHRSMAPGLVSAAARLRAEGWVIVFWDCYRPHAAQVRMFEVVPDPNWVARPGQFADSHEAARSVDITLARRVVGGTCAAKVRLHCLADMGTDFDDFTPRAFAYATAGVSPAAQANRARLRQAMNAGGIVVYSGEWWHFDGPGALDQRPHLDVPVN